MSKPNPTTTTAQPNRLQAFRQALYAEGFVRARDALFELVDALLLQPVRRSFVELALCPCFQRQWPSVYAALRHGRLDPTWLEKAVLAEIPAAAVFALDGTAWRHPQARTLAERQYCAVPVGAGRVIVPGHPYSLLTWIPERGGSWALPVAAHRLAPGETAAAVGVAQVRRLAQARQKQAPARRTVVAADGAYGNHRFLGPLRDEPGLVVVARLRRDRVLYRPPGRYPGRGRPRKHGARFAFKEPATWGEPAESVELADERWGQVRLRRWDGLHAREEAAGAFSVVLVESHRERKEPPPPLWLACQGAAAPAARAVWEWDDQRWPIEPAIHFRKQALSWTLPRFQSPERCDRWTALVTVAQWQLWLARELVADRRLPWQAPQVQLTPGRVQAGLGALFATMDRPVAAPQTRGKAPGWPRGRERARPTRHPVVRKSRPRRRLGRRRTRAKRLEATAA